MELAQWAVQRASWRREGALGVRGAVIAGVLTLVGDIGAFNAPAPPVVLRGSIQAATGGALAGLAYAALAEQFLATARWRRWVAGVVVGLAFLAGLITLPLWRVGHVHWGAVWWCGIPASMLLGLWLVPPQRAVAEAADPLDA